MSSVEYRKITFPKIDWESNEDESNFPELSPEIAEILKTSESKKEIIIFL